MVKYLLDSGADNPRIIHERCFGNFMSPEDQKASRFDNMEHEWVCVTPETDYNGCAICHYLRKRTLNYHCPSFSDEAEKIPLRPLIKPLASDDVRG